MGKIKTSLGFWFSYQNTPYETLISPNLNCDLVTSLPSSNLNLNSTIFKYVALLYKGKVVIANQFLYQNTPYGTLMSSNLNWPCNPIITDKSQFELCHFQVCSISAHRKNGNCKPISIPKHTLWDPCVTQFEMQIFDPIITFKCWFKSLPYIPLHCNTGKGDLRGNLVVKKCSLQQLSKHTIQLYLKVINNVDMLTIYLHSLGFNPRRLVSISDILFKWWDN